MYFFVKNVNRPNIQYNVELKSSNKDSRAKIVSIVKDDFSDQTGIVYSTTKKQCEKMCEALQESNISCASKPV